MRDGKLLSGKHFGLTVIQKRPADADSVPRRCLRAHRETKEGVDYCLDFWQKRVVELGANIEWKERPQRV